MANCKSCNAPIIWATTQAGRPMPFDKLPVLTGNFFLHTVPKAKRGEPEHMAIHVDSDHFAAVHARLHEASRYTSHFATCPNASKHRKAR